MPRVGIDYETIKYTAIKLLSQGHAPSVQKVREVLGTGSNTTIAEHLKTWREEHASKEIHHLPANMPKELISAIEVLWQTAMDQATQQLASIKHDLNEQQEKFRLEKAALEKSDHDLRLRLSDALKLIDEKTNHIQALQSEIAVTNEKLTNKTEELITIEKQYESLLDRAFHEKNNEILKSENLQKEILHLKQQLSDEIKNHQVRLNEERALQEQSEIRFIKLIDQARTETIEQRKRYETAVNKKNNQIETIQATLSDFHEKQATHQAILNEKNSRISEISEKHMQIEIKYREALETISILKERLNHVDKNTVKFTNKKNMNSPIIK